jgi:hypothetical protein
VSSSRILDTTPHWPNTLRGKQVPRVAVGGFAKVEWSTVIRADHARLLRAGAVALWLIALLTGCSGSHPSAPSSTAGGGVGLRIVASKPQYRKGEQVTVNITVTNANDHECRLSKLPQGVITIVSLTREGAAVGPASGTADFYVSFSATLAANLVTVPAGKAVQISLATEVNPATGAGNALVTYSADGRGGATLAAWPIDAAGHYQLSISYLRPPLPNLPVDSCSASSAPATAEFSVMGA